MLRSVALLLASMVALAAGSSTALAARVVAKPSDVAATRAYLTALHSYERASNRLKGSQVVAALDGLVAHINSDCPNVLVGAPVNEVTKAIQGETVADVVSTLNRLTRRATLAFDKMVQGLRWSNRKLTYYVHGAAAEGKANAKLVAPDICADARTALASGFQTVPPSTLRFHKQIEAANDKTEIVSEPGAKAFEGLQEIILRLLKPYEVPGEKTIIPTTTTQHERDKSEVLGLNLIFGTAGRLTHALGLPESKSSAESKTPTTA